MNNDDALYDKRIQMHGEREHTQNCDSAILFLQFNVFVAAK